MSKPTTIRVHQSTKQRLWALGEKGETYEETLLRLIAEKEAKQ